MATYNVFKMLDGSFYPATIIEEEGIDPGRDWGLVDGGLTKSAAEKRLAEIRQAQDFYRAQENNPDLTWNDFLRGENVGIVGRRNTPTPRRNI